MKFSVIQKLLANMHRKVKCQQCGESFAVESAEVLYCTPTMLGARMQCSQCKIQATANLEIIKDTSKITRKNTTRKKNINEGVKKITPEQIIGISEKIEKFKGKNIQDLF